MAAQAVPSNYFAVGHQQPVTEAGWIQQGAGVLRAEAQALLTLATEIGPSFAAAISEILRCQGSVIVTGIGKAGIIGRKFSATLSSTGVPSHFVHPAEAVHGDLGALRGNDLVIALSYSGQTSEITRLIDPIRESGCRLIALTASCESQLGQAADVVVELGLHVEACSLGLAPTTTTTCMLALCDALSIVISQQRGLTSQQFARHHPAGNLGRQLTCVCEVMRPLIDCRLSSELLTVREVMIQVGRPGRRTGAVMLVDSIGRLTGIFTDSDLARMLERCEDNRLDQPIHLVMTKNFRTIASDQLLPVATELMASHRISELPVVDSDGQPVGLIDITDLVGIVAHSANEGPENQASPTMQSSAMQSSDHPASEAQPVIFSIRGRDVR
jgi:arabinose-5-phosphate isomerase